MTDSPIISTRVRLARNIKNKPFVNNAPLAILLDIRRELSDVFKSYGIMNMESITPQERQMLVERHLISRELAANAQSGTVCLSSDQNTAVMLNEEDHLRIQVIGKGMDLYSEYEKAKAVDAQVLAAGIEYAYDNDWGYLTCCPTNVGTGMRASAMLHLPALSLTNKIQKVTETVAKLGISVRGMYGDGSKADGDIFQVSNRITLGVTPSEIIKTVDSACEQIVEMENDVRRAIAKNGHVVDRVCRACGILKSVRMLSLQEAMQLLSDAKLGIGMNLLSCPDSTLLDELSVKIQPAVLAGTSEAVTEQALQEKRAQIVRKAAENISITL